MSLLMCSVAGKQSGAGNEARNFFIIILILDSAAESVPLNKERNSS